MNRNTWKWVLLLLIAFLLAMLFLILGRGKKVEVTTTTTTTTTITTTTTATTTTTIYIPKKIRRPVATTTTTTTTSTTTTLPPTTTTTTTSTTTTTLPWAPHRGWILKGGYFAGGARVCLGYELPFGDSLSAVLDGGYGAGNNFTVASVDASLIYPLTRERSGVNHYLALEANYSDFSKKVVDVLVLDSISKGGGFGAGLVYGIARDNLFLQAGFDSRTGLLAEGGLRL